MRTKCTRCGVCCRSGVCSLGEEGERGICKYLIEEDGGKTSCELILDDSVSMKLLIASIDFGRGCVLKRDAEIYKEYVKLYTQLQ
jgi:hypothetical protein